MFHAPYKRRFAVAISLMLLVVMLFPLFSSRVFADSAQAFLSPSSGASDTQVTVTGSGWTPGNEICVYWDARGSNVLTCVASGTDGTFTSDFTVPQVPAGAHTVYVQNQSANSTQLATASFTVTSGQPPAPVQPCTNGSPSSQLPSPAKDKAHCAALTPHQAWVCPNPIPFKDCNYLETASPVSDLHYAILDETTNLWYYPNPAAVPVNNVKCKDWCNQSLVGGHNHIGVHSFWAVQNGGWEHHSWFLFYDS